MKSEMKTPEQWREIIRQRGATSHPLRLVRQIQADALMHAAAKIRNTGSSSQQWIATELEAEVENLNA